MNQALAMMELKSIARGLEVADTILKGYPLELLSLKIVCPGKLLLVVTGEVGAIREAIPTARQRGHIHYIDDFFLGNPHPQLIAAMRGATPVDSLGALGIIETFTATAAVLAADVAAKAALVQLINVRLARGLAGRGYVSITGSVGAVRTALEQCEQRLERGIIAHQAVIPAPDPSTWATVL